MSRSVRLKNVKRSDGIENGRLVDILKTTVSTEGNQSAIARHLSLNSECSEAYCDDCFSILSHARSRHHLFKTFLSFRISIHSCTTS